MDKEEKQINIELKPEVARGSYSNLAIITHSRSEFILDFATILPGLRSTARGCSTPLWTISANTKRSSAR